MSKKDKTDRKRHPVRRAIGLSFLGLVALAAVAGVVVSRSNTA
jgi:hypothetical protein